MNELTNLLTKNQWVFTAILSELRKTFAAKLSLSPEIELNKLSLTFLSTKFYLKNSLNFSIEKPAHFQVLDSSNSDTEINTFIKKHFQTGVLQSAEERLPELSNWISEFNDLIKSDKQFIELSSFLEYACIVKDVNFRGASHPHFLGSLFLSVPADAVKKDFFVSIIHEAAHHELFLINFTDRLVNESFDHNMIHAPYQNRQRPPIGRLHSLHALYRMVQFEPTEKFVMKYKESLTHFDEKELTPFSLSLLKDVYTPYAKNL